MCSAVVGAIDKVVDWGASQRCRTVHILKRKDFVIKVFARRRRLEANARQNQVL
jgi:hypothetical protein